MNKRDRLQLESTIDQAWAALREAMPIVEDLTKGKIKTKLHKQAIKLMAEMVIGTLVINDHKEKEAND